LAAAGGGSHVDKRCFFVTAEMQAAEGNVLLAAFQWPVVISKN
jgi:hypothetical protein